MAGKIFINYRRGDDSGFVQALLGRLEQAFSRQQVFIDIDGIDPGVDFVRVLEEQVAQCDVLIAVIGKGWIDARDETNARRLDNPDDFVRIEIASALSQEKRVIPVLVGDARMPRSNELPEVLKPLAKRGAVRLTHERFRADTTGLVDALRRALEKIEMPRRTRDKVRGGVVQEDVTTRTEELPKVVPASDEHPNVRGRWSIIVGGGFVALLVMIWAFGDGAGRRMANVGEPPFVDSVLWGMSVDQVKARRDYMRQLHCAIDGSQGTALLLRDRIGATMFFDGRGGPGLNLFRWETPFAEPVFGGVHIHDRRADVEARIGKPDKRLAGQNSTIYFLEGAFLRLDYDDTNSVRTIWKSHEQRLVEIASAAALGCG
jgi:hypothetical protein